MSRNSLYLLVGLLLAAVIGLGVYVYQQNQAKPGVEVRVDENGLSIQGNG